MPDYLNTLKASFGSEHRKQEKKKKVLHGNRSGELSRVLFLSHAASFLIPRAKISPVQV